MQLQKEINISHEQIKDQYDRWLDKFRHQFQKKSLRKQVIVNSVCIDKKTIVFDLDETLVRAQEEEPENGYDARIRVIDSERKDYYVS